MNATFTAAVIAAVAAAAAAQSPNFLFSVSNTEQTASGSGGTVLATLRPNEVQSIDFFAAGCAGKSAEKWTPRTCFHVMAGDEDGDVQYWEPGLFTNIDALLTIQQAVLGPDDQRTVFWSPQTPMGTTVSGGAGLRPGDVGRIVRTTSGDGKVEYFIRAEQIQMALGLPPTPVFVDVDAVAAGPNFGVFFSLDIDTPVATMCGVTFVRDGDVLCIPPWGLSWTTDLRVASVMPGSAQVVYTETQMDTFTANAQVTDRNGVCVNQVVDLEALEIDLFGPSTSLPACSGLGYVVPTLLFTAETLTGASVLTTAGGGQIANSPCGPLGTSCGFGPTFGTQMGLRPPSPTVGVASHITALASSRFLRYTTEFQNHVIPAGTAGTLHIASPGVFNFVLLTFAPMGPGAVPMSTTYAPSLTFPDFYNPFFYMGPAFTPGGFGTWTTPVVPWPAKLLFQCVTFNGSNFDLSTPAMLDIL